MLIVFCLIRSQAMKCMLFKLLYRVILGSKLERALTWTLILKWVRLEIRTGIVYSIDSLMGGILQKTRYSEAKKIILQDESKAEGPVKVVSRLNIFTNN
ncbi:hypothetical protein AN958_10503 [Leucoagaricus sp. SymC.cos]|nr:hypothetical protein AN958_10503 [Leucoagaricus sp. SymC.cos]